MGYRAEWVNHAGAMAVHSENALAAFDLEVPTEQPLSMLLVGVGDGGPVEVWRKVNGDGIVSCMDNDPACATLPGIAPILCDVTDKAAVREALRGRWFDVIIDATGTMSPHTWPFLAPRGRLLYETYKMEALLPLVASVAAQTETWLPMEEILRLDIFPDVLVIEKRPPMVVPPLRVMAGNFADRTGEEALRNAGVRAVITE